jgi:hypothetical protein
LTTHLLSALTTRASSIALDLTQCSLRLFLLRHIFRCGRTTGHLSEAEVMAQPDGFPFTVTEGKEAALPKSAVNMLLTLRHIPLDCSSKMPMARSHSGYPWEGVLPYVKHPFHPIFLDFPFFFCSWTLSDCAITPCGGLRCDLTESPRW